MREAGLLPPVDPPPSAFQRWGLRAAPWPLLLFALAAALWFCWAHRSPSVAMVGLTHLRDLCLAAFLFGLIAAGRLIQLTIRGACESRLHAPNVLRSSAWFWPWLILLGAGTCLAIEYRLPMHAGLMLSRPALDRIADEALADPAAAHRLAGRWAGVYRVARVEVIGGTVVAYLGAGRHQGFARVPGVMGDRVGNGSRMPAYPDHADFPRTEGFPDPVGERADGDWFILFSVYELVKVGWS